MKQSSGVRSNPKNKKKITTISNTLENSTPKKTVNPKSTTQENKNNEFQKKNRHRMLFVMKQLSSRNLELHLTNGSVICGLTRAIHPKTLEAIIQCARVKKGNLPEGFETGKTLTIPCNQISFMKILSVPLFDERMTNGHTKFLTDSQISTTDRANLVGRTLEVASSWIDPKAGQDDDGLVLSNDKNIDKWDQFEANERLFGVQDRYDENLYTTKLDKDKISSEMKMKALRIAKEIEGETSNNPHLLEERGKQCTWRRGTSSMEDEEQKYSAVLKGTNKLPESEIGSWRRTTDAKRKAFNDSKNKERNTEAVSRSDNVHDTSAEDPSENVDGTSNEDNKPQMNVPLSDSEKLENSSESLEEEKTKTHVSQLSDSDEKSEKTENDGIKKKLNPNAKEFVFNVSAPSFKPSGTDSSAGYNKQSNMNNASHTSNRRVHRYKGPPSGVPHMIEQEYLPPHCMPMPYPMMYPPGEWYSFDPNMPQRYYGNEQSMMPGPIPYMVHGAQQGMHMQQPLGQMPPPDQRYYPLPTSDGIEGNAQHSASQQQNTVNAKATGDVGNSKID